MGLSCLLHACFHIIVKKSCTVQHSSYSETLSGFSGLLSFRMMMQPAYVAFPRLFPFEKISSNGVNKNKGTWLNHLGRTNDTVTLNRRRTLWLSKTIIYICYLYGVRFVVRHLAISGKPYNEEPKQ